VKILWYSIKEQFTFSRKIELSIFASALMFFSLFVEPDSPERWDYFFILSFLFLLKENLLASVQKKYIYLVIPILLASSGYIQFRNREIVQSYKKFKFLTKNIPTIKKLFISSKHKKDIPYFSIFLKIDFRNVYLFKIKNNRCHYYSSHPNLIGFWDIVPTNLNDKYKFSCLDRKRNTKGEYYILK